MFGLIATNTLGQGDTRDTGLAAILRQGGATARAIRRLKWPGEAAVVVSVVHLAKAAVRTPVLDGRQVRRISAYLVEGDLDEAPERLEANARTAFEGSKLIGIGFTFDDSGAAKGATESLDTMHALLAKDSLNGERIFPYLGGEEVNTSPTHAHHRYVIDFFDRPLRRDPSATHPWHRLREETQREKLRSGIVSADYPGEVAEDWPDLIEIVRRHVKPARDGQKRDALRQRWWQYAEKRPGLYRAISGLRRVIAVVRVSPHLAIAFLPTGSVFSDQLDIVARDTNSFFGALQSRPHEVWARFFASSMKDDLRYTPSDCFETFPFPEGFETDPVLEAAGRAYHDHRAALMIARDEGMTKTYNRFHNRDEQSEDIVRLRELHAAMDRAVLRAYGWDDLADRAEPIFLDETSEDDHTYQGRLFWPSAFRDEVLARLLALNAERAAAERAAGIEPSSAMESEDEEQEAAE
jgi:hypothetical protein